MKLMQKLSLAVFVSMASAPAFAAGSGAGYGMAGCGLGSIVAKELSWGDSMVQVLASTTNGTAGSQTFGITSGTSNCGAAASPRARDAVKGKKKEKAEQKTYLYYNMAQIKADAARGQGEYIEGLAGLFGCQNQITGSYSDFAGMSQRNLNKIFSSNDADVVLNNYDAILANEKIGCGV